MIKDNRRYRNFMIVFEDDRYYICKASSFSKTGNNRYNWKDIATIDEAKKIIDKYWEENDKEVNESMIKNRARGRKIESKDEDLEVLNEYEDEDEELSEAIGWDGADTGIDSDIKFSNGVNASEIDIIKSVMYMYGLNGSEAREWIKSGKLNTKEIQKAVTYYWEEKDAPEFEATNPSNIGSFKRSSLVNRARKSKKNKECEDRIITKDDELNKPTNVKDDEISDTININVPATSNPSNNDSNTDNSVEQQEDEVILTEVSDFDKSNITVENGAVISTKYGDITINRIYAHWNPFENKVETRVELEADKNGKKIKDTVSVDKIFSYID